MADAAFRHIDPDAFHGKELSLHDSTADRILLENDTLRFFLPDGFWVTPQHAENVFGKGMRTDAAEVDFSVEDIGDIAVRVFTNHRWPGFRNTSVELWDIQQLISAVNSGKCTLQFVTQYRAAHEQLWHCTIFSRKRPYHRECHLHLPDSSAVFCWNDLRPDCEW